MKILIVRSKDILTHQLYHVTNTQSESLPNSTRTRNKTFMLLAFSFEGTFQWWKIRHELSIPVFLSKSMGINKFTLAIHSPGDCKIVVVCEMFRGNNRSLTKTKVNLSLPSFHTNSPQPSLSQSMSEVTSLALFYAVLNWMTWWPLVRSIIKGKTKLIIIRFYNAKCFKWFWMFFRLGPRGYSYPISRKTGFWPSIASSLQITNQPKWS